MKYQVWRLALELALLVHLASALSGDAVLRTLGVEPYVGDTFSFAEVDAQRLTGGPNGKCSVYPNDKTNTQFLKCSLQKDRATCKLAAECNSGKETCFWAKLGKTTICQTCRKLHELRDRKGYTCEILRPVPGKCEGEPCDDECQCRRKFDAKTCCPLSAFSSDTRCCATSYNPAVCCSVDFKPDKCCSGSNYDTGKCCPTGEWQPGKCCGAGFWKQDECCAEATFSSNPKCDKCKQDLKGNLKDCCLTKGVRDPMCCDDEEYKNKNKKECGVKDPEPTCADSAHFSANKEECCKDSAYAGKAECDVCKTDFAANKAKCCDFAWDEGKCCEGDTYDQARCCGSKFDAKMCCSGPGFGQNKEKCCKEEDRADSTECCDQPSFADKDQCQDKTCSLSFEDNKEKCCKEDYRAPDCCELDFKAEKCCTSDEGWDSAKCCKEDAYYSTTECCLSEFKAGPCCAVADYWKKGECCGEDAYKETDKCKDEDPPKPPEEPKAADGKLWWLDDVPWWMPPPPEWGAAPKTMMSDFFTPEATAQHLRGGTPPKQPVRGMMMPAGVDQNILFRTNAAMRNQR